MKQKIVFNVPLCEEKSRKKAMKLASQMKGVIKVKVETDMNHLVVVGEGVDSVKLANLLRKKFCFANIVSIASIRNAPAPAARAENPTRTGTSYPPQPHVQPSVCFACPVYDPNPPNSCSIM